METIYEILICLTSGWNIEREIREYKMIPTSDERHGKSFTASRKGSIGTYILYENGFDKELKHGNGIKFMTRDKKKLKEYGKLCDEHMEKYLKHAIKTMENNLTVLGTPWDKHKKTNTKGQMVE